MLNCSLAEWNYYYTAGVWNLARWWWSCIRNNEKFEGDGAARRLASGSCNQSYALSFIKQVRHACCLLLNVNIHCLSRNLLYTLRPSAILKTPQMVLPWENGTSWPIVCWRAMNTNQSIHQLVLLSWRKICFSFISIACAAWVCRTVGGWWNRRCYSHQAESSMYSFNFYLFVRFNLIPNVVIAVI